jgi:DNA polymerase/3'-5' exonuclease PolX
MELEKALIIADDLVKRLKPFCEIIEIAGSIRRKKSEVKDIELVIKTKKIEISDGDLFEPKFTLQPIPSFGRYVNDSNFGKVLKGEYTGRYMQIALNEGINLDLFIPAEEDFFRQYAIRTGSSEYSHKVIANGWRKIGWVGSDVGLRKMIDCNIDSSAEKPKWTCVNPEAELPPVWKSEREFFDWIQVPFLEPENRTI